MATVSAPSNRPTATKTRQTDTRIPSLSVVVLVYNEVDSIEPLHRELMSVMESLDRSFEVIYIDDGSRDGSSERLGQLAVGDERVRVVCFRRNFGQTSATQAGIDHSRGDVLVFMDGDLQNDPHDIPQLLAKIDEGYDVVSGWRKNRHDSGTRVLPSKIANWLIGRVTGLRLNDFGCTLKAYRREVIRDVKLFGEMHRFIPIYSVMLGARVVELPVNHRARSYGKSKYSLSRTFRVMLDLATIKLFVSYSTKPMHLFGYAAFWLWAMAAILAMVTIVQRLLPPYVYVHNNPLLLLAVVLGVIGVQFIFMGLLAELSIRTLQESRAKPMYVVREIIERSPAKQIATDRTRAPSRNRI
jgi:glycosyltransferase involved in cell wall biosynthesis